MYIHFNKLNNALISSLIYCSLVCSEFLHEWSPVFVTHFNHGCVKAVVLCLNGQRFSSLSELLTECTIEINNLYKDFKLYLLSCCARVCSHVSDSYHKSLLSVTVLHRDNERLGLCLYTLLRVYLHYEET
jgi:hypothetical protein